MSRVIPASTSSPIRRRATRATRPPATTRSRVSRASDLLDFSTAQPRNPEHPGSADVERDQVTANSIAWVYLGGNAMVLRQQHDRRPGDHSTNANLMEITLAGVSSGLSNSNFTA